jgi:hypothetical protein
MVTISDEARPCASFISTKPLSTGPKASLEPTSCVVGVAGQRHSEAGYPGGDDVVDPCRACDRRNSGAGPVSGKKISTLSTVRPIQTAGSACAVHEKAAAVEMNMNNDLVTKVVYCLRDGKVIGGPYRVSHARTFGPTSPPISERLIAEAKANLSSEGLASPPFEEITFEIRDP